jgi:hypothetical protein
MTRPNMYRILKEAQERPRIQLPEVDVGDFPAKGTLMGGVGGSILAALLAARALEPGRSNAARRARLRKIIGAGVGGFAGGAGLGGLGEVALDDFAENMEARRAERERQHAIREMLAQQEYDRFRSSVPWLNTSPQFGAFGG